MTNDPRVERRADGLLPEEQAAGSEDPQAQAAEILGLSTSTADRYWAYARAWLYADLETENSGAVQ